MRSVEYVEPEPVAIALAAISPQLLSARGLTTTPSFVGLQGYRQAAPAGIDAVYGNTVTGGKGTNVRVIDLEWDWRQTHEDLTRINGKLIPNGTPAGQTQGSCNHGTATMGVLVGDENAFGVTGIAPSATPAMVNVANTQAWSLSFANAIQIATANSVPGDVILLEVQISGPNWTEGC